MKKIISLILAVVTIASVFCIGTGAVGTLKFSDNFEYAFAPSNWMLRGGYDTCAYIWDHNNKYLYGMDDAIALQSNFQDGGKLWSDCMYSIDIRLQQAGLGVSKKSSIVIQYQDLYETLVQYKPMYKLTLYVQSRELMLTKEFFYTNEYGEEDISWAKLDSVILPEGAFEVAPDADWFNIAMRVTKGKIQCYFNEELVLESAYKANDTKLGRYNQNTPDTTVGTQRYPFIFLNYDNVLNLDNFEVWSGDYDFTSMAGDANGDGKVTISDVSSLLKYIAKWDNVPLDPASIDPNADSKVNLADVSLLLKYIAKWDVTLKSRSKENHPAGWFFC